MTAGIVVGAIILVLVLLFGWAWARGTKAKAHLATEYPPPGRMVDVGGYRLHILCQGNRMAAKPTVVLEGGNGESGLTWATIQPEVARFAPVCAYDRAGLGWSERSPNPRTAANIAAELHTLLAQADVAPPYVLVGHSIGGLYARLYAHLYPDQVAGMILLDSAHEEQELRSPKRIQKLSRQSYKLMALALRVVQALNSIGLVALFAEQMKNGWPSPIPETVKDEYIGVACSDTRTFEALSKETGAVSANLDAARAAKLGSLGDMPLVVLSAGQPALSEGRGLSAEDVEQFNALATELHIELAALSSNGKRAIAHDSGHYIHIEQPEVVIDAIREVIDALSSE